MKVGGPSVRRLRIILLSVGTAVLSCVRGFLGRVGSRGRRGSAGQEGDTHRDVVHEVAVRAGPLALGRVQQARWLPPRRSGSCGAAQSGGQRGWSPGRVRRSQWGHVAGSHAGAHHLPPRARTSSRGRTASALPTMSHRPSQPSTSTWRAGPAAGQSSASALKEPVTRLSSGEAAALAWAASWLAGGGQGHRHRHPARQ